MAGLNTTAWNRVRYTLFAPIYDTVAGFSRQRERSIEILDPRPGERVLIVGSGTGLDLRHLPAHAEITAIDLTPAMVERTRRRADALGRSVEAEVMDAQDMAFAAGSFDAVVLHLVLAVVPDARAVAREVDRVLADHGRAVVMDKFVRPGERASLLRRAVNVVTSTVFSDITRRLEDILAGTGLAIVTREGVWLGDQYEVALLRKTPRAEDG